MGKIDFWCEAGANGPRLFRLFFVHRLLTSRNSTCRCVSECGHVYGARSSRYVYMHTYFYACMCECVWVCIYIYIFSVCVACVLRVWLDLGEIERDKILIRR